MLLDANGWIYDALTAFMIVGVDVVDDSSPQLIDDDDDDDDDDDNDS